MRSKAWRGVGPWTFQGVTMTFHSNPIHAALAMLIAGSALSFWAAQAQTAAPAQATQTAAAPAAPQLTIRDIYDRLEAAGYRDIREIEFDDGRYEVKAQNAKGERVKLKVNAATGAVEQERVHR
jgi:outer membrane receptor protein involved in Fe transport